MGKKIFLVFSGVLLFLFIVGTAFLWYKAFYYNNLGSVSSLQVKKESEEVALTENLFPMSETEASVVPNYKFSVKNVNDSKSRYEVVYKEQEVSGKQKLSKSQLTYQLILNGTIIKKGNLSDLKNDVLDDRYIMPNTNNQYELKVYISESAKDTAWQNKSYAYKVDINVKEDN
jgi:hypothetical protein